MKQEETLPLIETATIPPAFSFMAVTEQEEAEHFVTVEELEVAIRAADGPEQDREN